MVFNPSSSKRFTNVSFCSSDKFIVVEKAKPSSHVSIFNLPRSDSTNFVASSNSTSPLMVGIKNIHVLFITFPFF